MLPQAQPSVSVELSTKRHKFNKIDYDIFTRKKRDWNYFKKLFVLYIHDNDELFHIRKTPVFSMVKKNVDIYLKNFL